MKTKKLVKKLAVVSSESKGIGAAIGKLMRRRNVIDIVECFQTKHALQEDWESPHVEERRRCSGPYPFNKMNSKASTKRKSKS